MGIEFGGNVKKADHRIGQPFEIDEAIEHLNNAIDKLIVAERKYEEAGLIVEKNFITRLRQRAESLRNDLARAIAL